MKTITRLVLASLIASVSIAATATQYSKLSIITEAKALGKWAPLKEWIQQSGYYDEWLVCQYLSDDHPAIPALTNAIVTSGVMTAHELGTIMAKSKDTAVPDSVLIGRYSRDVKREDGRIAWHGKRVSWREDTNTLTTVSVYADGTTFTDPFNVKRPRSAAARLALIEKQRKDEEERRIAQLPPDLQDVERQRIANASKTNEVNVTYTPSDQQ